MRYRSLKKGKGFAYYVTKEQIREYMKLSPELKLKWLEEANEFIWKYGKNKEIREKFREGEI